MLIRVTGRLTTIKNEVAVAAKFVVEEEVKFEAVVERIDDKVEETMR